MSSFFNISNYYLVFFGLMGLLWNTSAFSQNAGIGLVTNAGQLRDQFDQEAEHVSYYFNQAGLQVLITDKGFAYEVFEQKDDSIQMHRIEFNLLHTSLIGIVPKTTVTQGLVNHVDRTNADKTWNVTHHEKLLFEDVYPGIDLEFDVSSGDFKYNFLLGPEADPAMIHFKIEGAVADIKHGEIAIATRFGELLETIPLSYVLPDASAIEVEFVEFDDQVFGYALVDPSESGWRGKNWVIDPTPNRLWGSYWGGTAIEFCYGMAEDNSGNTYLCGVATGSPGFTTVGAHQVIMQGSSNDAFLNKFNNAGILQWCTYFGGDQGDIARGIVAQGDGTIYMCGNTTSAAGFATTGAYRTTYGGGSGDGFICKFSTSGVLQWSTYIGNTLEDVLYSIDYEPTTNMIVATGQLRSTGQASSGTHQTVNGGNGDAFIIKMNSSGSFQWATYFGGTGEDFGYAAAFRTDGSVAIAGSTASSTAISTAGASQTAYAGAVDGFLLLLNNNGTRNWSTYQGGSSADALRSVEFDFDGNIIGLGQTSSTNNISTVGANQTALGGSSDAFLFQMDAIGTKLWGTYIGGSGIEDAMDLALDTTNNIYIVGNTSSTTTIATAGAHQAIWAGGYDGMIMQFSKAGMKNWGTYYGGTNSEFIWSISVDLALDIFIGGHTGSATGIGTVGTSQPNHSAGISDDPFVVRFGPLILPVRLGAIDVSCSSGSWTMEWETISEEQSDYFEILGSTDGILWLPIKRVQAAYSSNASLLYQAQGVDWDTEWQYIRLSLVNANGNAEVLHTAVSACFDVLNKVTIYPNPTTDRVICKGNFTKILVHNTLGKAIWSIDFNAHQNQWEWSTKNWSPGMYTIQVYNGTRWSTHRLIKE